MNGDELLALLEAALLTSTADQTEIVTELVHQEVTRYANSQLHQTTVLDEQRVWVRCAVGKAVGQARGDALDGAGLRSLVAQAVETARRQAPNPEFVSFAEPAPLVPVAGFDAATAHLGAADRAEAIGRVVVQAAERGWTAAGTYLSEGREVAAVNSLGVRSYAPRSRAYIRALMDSGAGTGYAADWAWRASDLDVDRVAVRAMERCARNRDQREIAPGEYEAIFDDLAVAETLYYLALHGFSGKAYEEGTSFLSGRIGQQVAGPQVTIWDDALDPSGLPVASDYEGTPKQQVPLLEAGVARGVVYDSYTAHLAGRRSTGHAVYPERSYYGPVPANLFMAGGDATLKDMVRATKRGVLVTRFHYTHGPERQRVVMTGTTRDGTYLVENGEIVGAVRNLRFVQSVPELFEGIEMLGRPRLCQDWWCSNGMGDLCYVCPPIKVRRAVFQSGTLF